MKELASALIEWRDARQVIFDAKESTTPDMWTRLGDAEHKLMALARMVEPQS